VRTLVEYCESANRLVYIEGVPHFVIRKRQCYNRVVVNWKKKCPKRIGTQLLLHIILHTLRSYLAVRINRILAGSAHFTEDQFEIKYMPQYIFKPGHINRSEAIAISIDLFSNQLTYKITILSLDGEVNYLWQVQVSNKSSLISKLELQSYLFFIFLFSSIFLDSRYKLRYGTISREEYFLTYRSDATIFGHASIVCIWLPEIYTIVYKIKHRLVHDRLLPSVFPSDLNVQFSLKVI